MKFSAARAGQWAAAWSFVAATVAACGGGGGSDGGGGNSTTRRFLLDVAGPVADGRMTFANGEQVTRSQAIVAVDPASPGGGVVTVEPAGQTDQSIPLNGARAFTLANGLVSDSYTRYVIYFKAGRLYRLDAEVSGSGVPVAELLTTLRSNEVCARFGRVEPRGAYADSTRAASSWFFLPAPGADGVCDTSDDNTRAVRLDMSATAVAPTVGKPLAGIYNPTDRTLQGFIVLAGNEVQRLDANLASATPLFNIDAASFTNVETIGFRLDVWLFQESQQLWAVSLSNPTVRTALAPLAAGETVSSLGQGDADDTYLQINTATTSRIVRIDRALTLSTVAATATPVLEALLTPTRLVWSTAAGLQSIPRAGGSPTPVLTLGVGQSVTFFYNAGETLWVRRDTRDPISFALSIDTLVIDSTGTPVGTHLNSAIVSFQFPAAFPVVGPVDGYAVLLAEGLASGSDYSGASVRSYRAANDSLLTTFGSLPAGLLANAVYVSGAAQYGQPGVLEAFNSRLVGNTVEYSTDLFYFDSDAPGLTRLTNHLPPSP